MLESRNVDVQAHHHKCQKNVVYFGQKYRNSRAWQASWNTDYTTPHFGQKS